MKAISWLLVFWVASPPPLFGQSPVEESEEESVAEAPKPKLIRLSGQVRERGTRRPLSGVNVFVLPEKLKTSTDETGGFSLEIPEGAFQWVLNIPGYQRLEQADTTTEASRSRSLIVEKIKYASYETTVVGQGEKRDDTQKTLRPEEFLQMPGSGGDPIKAVQNLPGVNRPNPLSSQIIIEGSDPQDTRYLLDGHEIPLIFHFGGLSSVVFPESLDRVDFLTSGFGPEYGRTNAGVVGVWTRQPTRERLKGFAFMDVLNSGALIEGPVTDKSSFLLAGRYSYIGPVLRAVLPKSSDFNLTVAPGYSDLLGVYDTELSPNDQLRITGIYSKDTLEFLLAQPVGQDPNLRGHFSNSTSFYRLIPQWRHRVGEDMQARISLGLGRDFVHVDAGQMYFDLADYFLTTRAEIETKMSESWTSQLGLDNRFTWAHVNLLLPNFVMQGGVVLPISPGNSTKSICRTITLLGAYWRNEWRVTGTPWSILPSLRGEYYSTTHEGFALPRLSVRYQIDDSLKLRVNTGLYAQPPLDQEVDRQYGNPNIKANRAWHVVVGVDKDFRGGRDTGWLVSSGVFYKRFSNLVIPSTNTVVRDGVLTSENYNNNGSGKAFGLTANAKWALPPWGGMLSYTLSRSTRWDPQQSEYTYAYDQTHFLSAVTAVELGSHWRLSGRLRYATGNPTTPIIGAFYDADSDIYIPIRGPFYSRRLASFFQVDARVDKQWIFKSWILSAYLDVQNILNRKNLEGVQYAYDYSTSATISGLPILPTFGVKAEF